MKKETYEQPKMEVVKLEQTDIICTSQTEPYQDGNTDGWYNS